LTLALVVAPPMFGVGQTVRASFVLEVGANTEPVSIRGGLEEHGWWSTVVVTDRVRTPHTELPVRSQNPTPFNQPVPFGPTKPPPKDPHARQGMGGAGDWTSGFSFQVAGLPLLPFLIDSDLRVQLLMEAFEFTVEEFSSRLFRPPRPTSS
jgi:hypothetical protein